MKQRLLAFLTRTLFYYTDSIDDRNRLSMSVFIPLAGLRSVDETIESVINQIYTVYENFVLRNGIKDL